MFPHKSDTPLTRRDALRRVGNGFGMLAFASTVNESLLRAGVSAADGSVMVGKLDYPQRVKRVIFLFMNGGSRRWTASIPSRTWKSTTDSRCPADRLRPNAAPGS